MFFAPRDQFEPCGMFTAGHIIALAVSLFLIVFALFLTRDMTVEVLNKILKVMAFVLTFFETVKIIYNFAYGYFAPDYWMPLSFCGLFIYALWLSGYSKGLVAEAAKSYIEGAAFFAGLAFLVIPATSLMVFPLFHFQCVYSLLFHSCMIFTSICFMRLGVVRHDLKHLGYFCAYYLIFALFALVLNIATGSNIMLIMKPYNIPFAFFNAISDTSVVLYILFVSAGYTVINYGATYVVCAFVRLLNKLYERRESGEEYVDAR